MSQNNLSSQKTTAPWESKTKVRCRKCDDVIWSKFAGQFVMCKCGSIYVDQTPHYSRYGGDPTLFEYIEEEE